MVRRILKVLAWAAGVVVGLSLLDYGDALAGTLGAWLPAVVLGCLVAALVLLSRLLEEIRAITLSEEALDRSRESARMCGGDPARVKGDELFVKTAQWMSERLDRKKFGADAPLQDLKDELRHASNEMLIARVVGAITTAPALLERLAPKLQAILPPESMALLAETALKARQAQAVPGELVQDPPAEVPA